MGWATIRTARAEIECQVMVTRRNRPLVIGGNVIFRKRVNHPGNPPFRFAEQGLAQYRDTATQTISEEVNRGLKNG